MEQAEPIPRLVHGRLAKVVPVHGARGHRVRVDVASVRGVNANVRGSGGGELRRESAAAEHAAR